MVRLFEWALLSRWKVQKARGRQRFTWQVYRKLRGCPDQKDLLSQSGDKQWPAQTSLFPYSTMS